MIAIKKLFGLLTSYERKRAALLFCMILMMALLDVIGVASIMPFMAILTKPNLLETNIFLAFSYHKLGFSNAKDFLFFLGVIVFGLLIFSLAFKALTSYAQLRFALLCECNIGKRLVASYLYQPYEWFLNRHSADLGKNILSEVNTVILNGILPAMTLLSQSLVAVALLSLLIMVDPMLAITVGFILSVSYGLIFKLMNKLLRRFGEESVDANKKRFTVVSEAFGAIKDVKVGGLEDIYLGRFTIPAKKHASLQASLQIITLMPRFALEAIAIGGMLLIMLYLLARSSNFINILPIISLYVFAGYRLMPALQQAYHSLSQLRFTETTINNLHADLMGLKYSRDVSNSSVQMLLKGDISLNNISYSYPNSERSALNIINLAIPIKSFVGIVGKTGSGKTTLVDLILGLVEPQQGNFSVGGHLVNQSNRRQWQKCIGYVPQQIYLSDDTVMANIAFGIAAHEIDQSNVEAAAKMANIHDFIINELTEGYLTSVGERGVRLSGGQRQRIGIARALYRNPQLLILDEATSALDVLTEHAVMDAIKNLEHKVTIILIAHRLSTVRNCDTIYLLDDGSIRRSGTYQELLAIDTSFQQMIKGST